MNFPEERSQDCSGVSRRYTISLTYLSGKTRQDSTDHLYLVLLTRQKMALGSYHYLTGGGTRMVVKPLGKKLP
jgi:hypothetical protein